MVGATVGGIATVIGGEHEQVIGAQCGFDVGDTRIEFAQTVVVALRIPAVPPIHHDRDFFDALDANPIQAGILAPLRREFGL